jgi:hypothetical protein
MVAVLQPMLRRIARVGKWIFIAVYYSYVLRLIVSSGTPQFERSMTAAAFGVIFLLAILAMIRDRAREDLRKDDFRGNNLFYRYGGRIGRTVLPIPVHSYWTADDTARFATTLQEGLSRRIDQRLAGSSVQVSVNSPITDLTSGELKSFLRLVVRSRFGSMLTHFVHYAGFGRTITAHYFTFIRGSHGLLDLIEFVLLSPFTIWFWSLPWLFNCHSLIARISAFRDTSFELIDLDTMHSLTRQVMREETEQILTDAGLLTEEMRQILQYNFNQFQVNGSSDVVIQGVVQGAGGRSVRQAS